VKWGNNVVPQEYEDCMDTSVLIAKEPDCKLQRSSLAEEVESTGNVIHCFC